MVEPLTGDDPREVAGYQLRARLGAGGMGRVYLAFTRGGRPVAIKVVRAEFGDDEDFRDRFRQEVLAAQRVHGLYTAQVLDADPDARQPWLATAYVPGMSLRRAVTDHGPLPEESVFLLVAGIAEALQAIHAAGIVHRDLTPSNVILAADGPRVIDFGIARAAAAPALTRSGIRVGSPRFMAPEQARGQPTTPPVDVFALGSLATYAAAGRPPFGGGAALAVLYRVLNEAPDLDGCPPDLRPLIARCLAKDPALRPQPREIIDTCRARTADGALAFERSWLPAAVSAVAAGPIAPLIPGIGSGRHDASAGESTFPGDGSYSGPGLEGEDTFSGEVRDPPEGSAGDGSTPGAPQPEPAAAGPDQPGVARPLAGGQAVLLAAGMPVPLGTSSAGRAPGDDQPRAPRASIKTVVGWSAAAALVAAAAVVIALLPHLTSPDAGDN
ncbi:MAG TPA: serine/threonine-protein kinase, partial [Streptosporangiaceae bacterium]